MAQLFAFWSSSTSVVVFISYKRKITTAPKLLNFQQKESILKKKREKPGQICICSLESEVVDCKLIAANIRSCVYGQFYHFFAKFVSKFLALLLFLTLWIEYVYLSLVNLWYVRISHIF